MNEPQRIGLTHSTNQHLVEILDSLNAESEGSALIKKDIYRLAIALAIKASKDAQPISEKTEDFLRVAELDDDKTLYVAVQASGLCGPDEPVYAAMERLAESGIQEFYEAYKKGLDQIPWDKVLSS